MLSSNVAMKSERSRSTLIERRSDPGVVQATVDRSSLSNRVDDRGFNAIFLADVHDGRVDGALRELVFEGFQCGGVEVES
ncbi:hypothetical protein [Nocardia salmonicida]|uniref:hypothetical protein n=1 Tax=Nocardia salmonicida TaxID=53431 RepID=UPI003790E797